MAYRGRREWLYNIRYARRWSQIRTAVEAGISQSQYSLIENGYKDPSPEQAAAIAGALRFNAGMFEEANG